MTELSTCACDHKEGRKKISVRRVDFYDRVEMKGMISMYESLFLSTRWFSQISSGFFEDQQLPKSSASCPIPSDKRRSLNFDRLRMKL